MSLDFYQIIYDESQRGECYNFSKPYFNTTLTDFFENSIIENLVPKSSADYISVCSWRLRKKRQDGWVPSLCSFAGREDNLSEDKILNSDFDVAVLTPRSSSHRMLFMAGEWHRPNWEPAMKELKKFIKVPEEVKTPVYENHFIASKELYHEYVANLLNPVMQFMSDRSVFFADSGYAEKKKRTEPKSVEDYKNITGRNDWPIAPFILERLFSIWINDKQLKIINL